MVKAKRKPLSEIITAILPYKRILNTGCGGCASVCLVGGQKEVTALNNELNMHFKSENRTSRADGYTVERQCNMQFLKELDGMVESYDCMMSMACGAGAQLLAERFRSIPVFPAVNTVSIGVDREVGVYEEKCRACGDCVIGYTGGICPISRCSKGLFNGPCGGTDGDLCEVGQGITCAWFDIYRILKEQGRLDSLKNMRQANTWQDQIPNTIIQEPYEKRYR